MRALTASLHPAHPPRPARSAMKTETGEDMKIWATAGACSDDIATGGLRNNYSRPEGQVRGVACQG